MMSSLIKSKPVHLSSLYSSRHEYRWKMQETSDVASTLNSRQREILTLISKS